jgi:hypothetical protein
MPLDPSGVPSRAGIQAAIDDAVNDRVPPGAWASYVPSIGNWAVGSNGTLLGNYHKVGNTMHFRITFTLGSATTKSGILYLGLPEPMLATTPNSPVGQASLYDQSANATVHAVARRGVSSATIGLAWNNGTATNSTGLSATTPWTWDTNDVITVNGMYEVA